MPFPRSNTTAPNENTADQQGACVCPNGPLLATLLLALCCVTQEAGNGGMVDR